MLIQSCQDCAEPLFTLSWEGWASPTHELGAGGVSTLFKTLNKVKSKASSNSSVGKESGCSAETPADSMEDPLEVRLPTLVALWLPLWLRWQKNQLTMWGVVQLWVKDPPGEGKAHHCSILA